MFGSLGLKSEKPLHKEKKFEALYFCKSQHCLLGRPLSIMKFRCSHPACVPRDREYFKNIFPHDINEFFEHKFRCKEHYLPIVPRCPICDKIIGQNDTGRPTGLWAGRNAGKTVYSTALAYEINNHLYSLTKILSRPLYDNGEFYRKNVIPLFEKGMLPQKTNEGEHTKIAYLLKGSGTWASRVITLTDIAGEMYERDKDKPSEEILTLMNSRDSIFLINPQAVGVNTTLGGAVDAEKSGALKIILHLLSERKLLEQVTEPTVSLMIKNWAAVMNNRGFPACQDKIDALSTDLYHEIRAYINRHVPSNIIVDITKKLKDFANAYISQPTFQELYYGVVEFLKDNRYPTKDKKLDHKLAVVMTKADMIPDCEIEGNVPHNGNHKRKNNKGFLWYRELQALSNRYRKKLIELGEEKLVKDIESNFTQVGYFFVSSTGRGVDIAAKKISSPSPYEGNGSSHVPIHHPLGQGGGGTTSFTPKNFTTWELKPMVSKAQDGSHTPEPNGVLLPILWLLLQSN
ncbi:MAG: hypothetical protein ACMUJM_02860 [bacterium]